MESDAAPRAYRSQLRAAQAEQTRRRIVEAAARLFAAHGYQATTMVAVGREAGVSTETVKAALPKAELLIAAFEVTFSGAEGAESLRDTDAGAGVMELPDAVFLDAVVSGITDANARGHALWTVLLGAASSDPVVDEALQAMLSRRGADYRLLVDQLVARGYVDEVRDRERCAAVLSFLLSPESYQQLVTQSGLARDDYEAWVRQAILAELRR